MILNVENTNVYCAFLITYVLHILINNPSNLRERFIVRKVIIRHASNRDNDRKFRIQLTFSDDICVLYEIESVSMNISFSSFAKSNHEIYRQVYNILQFSKLIFRCFSLEEIQSLAN
jgi:hypothetical protein